jgi:hypothetical protein
MSLIRRASARLTSSVEAGRTRSKRVLDQKFSELCELCASVVPFISISFLSIPFNFTQECFACSLLLELSRDA